MLLLWSSTVAVLLLCSGTNDSGSFVTSFIIGVDTITTAKRSWNRFYSSALIPQQQQRCCTSRIKCNNNNHNAISTLYGKGDSIHNGICRIQRQQKFSHQKSSSTTLQSSSTAEATSTTNTNGASSRKNSLVVKALSLESSTSDNSIPNTEVPTDNQQQQQTKQQLPTSEVEYLTNIFKENHIRPPIWLSSQQSRPTDDIRTYNYVLKALSEKGGMGIQSEQLLRHMLQRCNSESSSSKEGNSNDNSSSEEDSMYGASPASSSPYNSISSFSKPTTTSLNLVLAAYCTSSEAFVPFRVKKQNVSTASRLVKEWKQTLYPNDLVMGDVDLVSYNTLITGYAKAGLAHQAERVFAALQQTSNNTNDEDASSLQLLRPDIYTYNALLDALAISATVDSSQRIHELFVEMSQRPQTKPTIHTYNLVLYGYANSAQPQQAEDFLLWWLMCSSSSEGKSEAFQNTNSTIATPLPSSSSDSNTDSATMVTPNTRSFNIVLHAMVKNDTNFKNKKRRYNNRRKPKTPSTLAEKNDGGYAVSYPSNRGGGTYGRDGRMIGSETAVSSYYAQYGAVERAEALFHKIPKKDTISYTTMIGAICKSSTKGNTHYSLLGPYEQIEGLVLDAIHDNDVVTDAFFVSNVLYSIANIDDSQITVSQFAERLFNMTVQEYHIEPTIAVYNALLHCWAKSTDYETTQKVLYTLKDLETSASLKPNVKTYTNVLDALKNTRSSSSIQEAERIVDHMEEYGPAPNVHAYTTLIMNYARSTSTPRKAESAAAVLRRMRSRGVEPNIIAYNAVLNACEHSTPRNNPAVLESALKVAVTTFDSIRSSPVQCNHVTYGLFVGTLSKLMAPEARQDIITKLFQQCCFEGLVSKLVLRKLRGAAVSTQRYHELLEHRDEKRLPAVWSARVREHQARREL